MPRWQKKGFGIDFEIWEKELNLHLETLPDMPDAIPYRTTYYKEDWGLCISYNQYINLNKNSNYEVVINTSLKKWLPNIWWKKNKR